MEVAFGLLFVLRMRNILMDVIPAFVAQMVSLQPAHYVLVIQGTVFLESVIKTTATPAFALQVGGNPQLLVSLALVLNRIVPLVIGIVFETHANVKIIYFFLKKFYVFLKRKFLELF